MKIAFRINRDTLGPALARGMATAQRPAKIWHAGALALVQFTKSAFSDAGKRQKSWPPKWGGSAATLRKTGTLWRSVRVTESNDRGAKLGTDRKYAAIHQFGGRIFAKPGGYLRFPGGDKKFMRAAINIEKKKFEKTGAGHPERAGFIFRKWVKIPARPFFPFNEWGKPMATAKMACSHAMRQALSRELTGGKA
ncbi:MAG TPA: phage virion morphogenesis protein [Verrucomicrobiae bacterium]|nr:phage virion morphogenesis protein [Verrucomicrobiae bacterium]